MGRALDDIYEQEVTSLYSQISVNATQVLGLKCQIGHLDSTSFHTDGIYETAQNEKAFNSEPDLTVSTNNQNVSNTETDLFALTNDESASQLETDQEIDSLRSKEATIRLESTFQLETDKETDSLRSKEAAIHLESASQLETDKETDSLRSKETVIHLESASQFETDKEKDAHAEVINITKGYSRDHRPDLNQVILQLIVENQAGIPILMKPMDGNSDDKTGFRETIQTHIKQLMTAHPLKYIISDSALYNEKSLQTLAKNPDIHWISRVPESINEAKEAIEKAELSEMTVIDEQTRYQAISSNYAGIEQRWILIHSCQAEKRAKHTINKQCLKASTANLKAFNNLCRKTFSSKEEAQEALQKFEKKLLFTSVEETEIKVIPRYKTRGKPAKNAKPDYYVYQIEGYLSTSFRYREARLKRKSCFIVATNEMNVDALPDPEVLVQYKNQQKVERGFRFLKDPMFLADSLFLKSPKRIMALMMVMTVCLLVYAALEYRMRQSIKEKNQTFPNQKGKLIKNPTIRWVFQYFVGIHVVILGNIQTTVTNLNEHHLNLLALLGKRYEAFYY